MKVQAPVQIAHRGRIDFAAPAPRVFAYMCPVRELEYVEGWNPSWVSSESGLAEPGCVFVTGEGEEKSVWTFVHHDAGAGELRLLKVTPASTVCDIEINVHSTGDESCEAEIAYAHTALTEAGQSLCREFDAEAFAQFLERFRAALADRLTRPE